MTALSDEKAWSENFGPFCLVGCKNDLFDRKVGDIRKNGRSDRFCRDSEHELGIQDIESEALLVRLRSGHSEYLVGKYDHRDRYTSVMEIEKLRFSQRMGITEIRTALQVEDMTRELRNSLWNVLDRHVWQTSDFLYKVHGDGDIKAFSEVLWSDFFKLATDKRPEFPGAILESIRNYFFECEWYEVYDFIEFCLWITQIERFRKLPDYLNAVLERELSGYRLIDKQFVPVVEEEQVVEVERLVSASPFHGARAHIKQAIRHLSNKTNPDYRNSIKESISAVESACQQVTGDSKATLGEALKILKKSNQLHGALNSAFTALYGYTSDAHGIRHAMLEEAVLTQADARYFLVTCSSFVNYLAEKSASNP